MLTCLSVRERLSNSTKIQQHKCLCRSYVYFIVSAFWVFVCQCKFSVSVHIHTYSSLQPEPFTDVQSVHFVRGSTSVGTFLKKQHGCVYSPAPCPVAWQLPASLILISLSFCCAGVSAFSCCLAKTACSKQWKIPSIDVEKGHLYITSTIARHIIMSVCMWVGVSECVQELYTVAPQRDWPQWHLSVSAGWSRFSRLKCALLRVIIFSMGTEGTVCVLWPHYWRKMKREYSSF